MSNLVLAMEAAATYSPKHANIFRREMIAAETQDVAVLANVFTMVCAEHSISPNMPNPYPRHSDEWHGWNACFPEYAEVHDEREAKAALRRLEAARHADPEPEDEAPEDHHQTLVGSGVQPAEIEIGETVVPLGNVVVAAHALSGLSVDAWNELPDDDREARIQAVIDHMRSTDALPQDTEEPAPDGEPVPEPAPEPVHGTDMGVAANEAGEQPQDEAAPETPPAGDAA